MTTKFINVALKSGNTNQKIKSLNSDMRGLGKTSDKTAKSVDGVSSSLGTLTKVATGVISALGIAQIKTYADNWTNANNRIKAATTTIIEFETAQKGVLAIAQEAGVELNGVADSYSRIAQATSELGVSQERVLDVTRKVTLALKAGGATAAETSSVLVQFAQGLGSGALQGDELKSILEASIPITKALAKEFNTTTGGLKKLGAEGKLTADRVVQAIEGIDQASLTFERDIAGGIAVANNAITVYVGQLDEALGATTAINGVLVSFADNIDVIADAVSIAASVLIARYASSLAVILASKLLLIERTTRATATVNTFGQVVSRTSRAANVAAVASRGLAGALALVGGPAGAATLAVTALIFFAEKAETASDRSERLANEVNDLTDGFKGLNNLQRKIEIEKITTEMNTLSGQLIKANEQLNKFKAFGDSPIKTQNINRLNGEITNLNKELDKLSVKQQAIFQSGTPDITQTTPSETAKPSGPNTQGTVSTNIDGLRARLALETDALAAELDNQRALKNGEITQQQFDDEAELQRIRFNFEEKRLAIDENEKLTAEQRAQLRLDLGEQELLEEQIFQDSKTAIQESGSKDRAKLDLLESNAKISQAESAANAGLKLLSAFGKKSFKAQKAFAIADSIVSITAGVAKALNNPYPANLGFAAQVAAQGVGLISTIKSTNPSGGGGTPSISGGGSTSSPTPTAPSQSQANQNRAAVVELNLAPDGIYTAAQVELITNTVVDAVSNNDDVVVAINGGQQEGVRTGIIEGNG